MELHDSRMQRSSIMGSIDEAMLVLEEENTVNRMG